MPIHYVLLLFAASATSVQQADKVVLKRVVSEGAARHYVMKGDFSLEFTGSKVTVEATLKSTYKGLVKEGERKNTLVHLLEWEEMAVELDGQDMGDMDRVPPPVTTYLKPDGSIAALTLEGGGTEGEVARLLATVFAVPFPTDGAEVGQVWRLSAEDLKNCGMTGSGEYRLQAVEQLESVKVAKVRAELKSEPRPDDTRLTVAADLWLDLGTGALVKGSAVIRDFAVQSLVVSGSVKIESKKPGAGGTSPAKPGEVR